MNKTSYFDTFDHHAYLAALPMVDKSAAVGSRITCDPSPVSADEDFLILIKNDEQFQQLVDKLDADGFKLEGSEIVDPADTGNKPWDFQSFRKDQLNLILTQNEEFYNKFLVASSVAKHLNLRHKGDRVVLFQAVLYANAFDFNFFQQYN